jgi:hypothetical protein
MSATGVPRIPTRSPKVSLGQVGERATAGREATREEYFGGARLLFSDARVVYLLLNEARSLAIARAFGISGVNSGLVTIIALGLAAETTHRKVTQALRAPGRPATVDVMIGGAALRESLRAIGRIGAVDSPVLGALVLTSVTGVLLRPVLGRTLRRIKVTSGQAHTDFAHRYGHIVRPSQRRR